MIIDIVRVHAHQRRTFGQAVAFQQRQSDAIEKMRIAGKLAADVLVMLDDYIKEGITTGALDKLAHDYIVDVQKAIPANVGYHGYQHTLCTSIG